MKVVSDCSPITNLITVGKLDLLQSLYREVYITPAVQRELSVSHPDFFGDRMDSVLPWIKLAEVEEIAIVEAFEQTLDRGEAETLSYAIGTSVDLVIMDERKGRQVALDHDVKVIGLLGVLLESKRRGYLDRVQPVMNDLIHLAEFWVAPDLYDQILYLANES